MSADLSIHVRPDELTEDHLRAFFSSTFGSPYFGARSKVDESEALKIITTAPSVAVGPVSTLKAAVTGEREKYIGPVSDVIYRRLGTSPTCITAEIISEVERAADIDDGSIYEDPDVERILTFLKEHEGEEAFTVTW